MTSSTDLQELVKAFDDEYDFEHGFLGQLREGVFDDKAAQRFEELFAGISEVPDFLPKHLVALWCFMPSYLDWQRDRMSPVDRPKLEHVIVIVENSFQRLLGVP